VQGSAESPADASQSALLILWLVPTPIALAALAMLGVGDGHHVYRETCGNPTGKPALVLHGGPGSGCSTGVRRYFDGSGLPGLRGGSRGLGGVQDEPWGVEAFVDGEPAGVYEVR
jgi:hypothetical protein